MQSVHSRNIANIKRKIGDLNLDLSGETVLTELGSNNYFYTPVIAALAGAEKVFVWTRSNVHFNVDQNAEEFMSVMSELNLTERIALRVDARPETDISSSTIITNSGFIRPIDDEFLSLCSDDVVIPLMYEAWELRATDVDIEAATSYGIKVAGTFENHQNVSVFDGVGPLAIKLSLEAGHEVYNNNIIVYSNDHFGEVTSESFRKFGATSVLQTISEEEVFKNLPNTDFIYLCNYHEKRTYGIELLNLMKLKEVNPNIGLVHLYGALNFKIFEEAAISVYPKKQGKSMIMSETLAYLGPQLLISLVVAGFKVGSLMRNDQKSDLVQPINY